MYGVGLVEEASVIMLLMFSLLILCMSFQLRLAEERIQDSEARAKQLEKQVNFNVGKAAGA